MMRYSFILLLFLCFTSSSILALDDDKLTRSEYIDMWKEEAIYQMVLHKIPASITLAQGILESGDGNSELARKANNHFGIKCHSDWKGKRVYHDDDKKGECFRHYKDAHSSFEDHSEFLLKKRYESLFTLKITDYKGWAKGLKACGYATSSKYAGLLIKIIEENDLTRFDKIGQNHIKKGTTPERSRYLEEEEVIAQKEEKKPKKENGRKNKGGDNGKLDDVSLVAGRAVKLSDNRIKYVIVKSGDNFEKLAEELDMMPWQLWKYNDLDKNAVLQEGSLLYLQPKRRNAKTSYHTVSEGESLWDISHRYGVKIKQICKYNDISPNYTPKAGERLALRSNPK